MTPQQYVTNAGLSVRAARTEARVYAAALVNGANPRAAVQDFINLMNS